MRYVLLAPPSSYTPSPPPAIERVPAAASCLSAGWLGPAHAERCLGAHAGLRMPPLVLCTRPRTSCRAPAPSPCTPVPYGPRPPRLRPHGPRLPRPKDLPWLSVSFSSSVLSLSLSAYAHSSSTSLRLLASYLVAPLCSLSYRLPCLVLSRSLALSIARSLSRSLSRALHAIYRPTMPLSPLLSAHHLLSRRR